MKVGATGRFPDGRKGTRLLSEQGERPVNPWRCPPDGYDVNSLTRGGTKTRAGQKGHEDNHATTQPNSS